MTAGTLASWNAAFINIRCTWSITIGCAMKTITAYIVTTIMQLWPLQTVVVCNNHQVAMGPSRGNTRAKSCTDIKGGVCTYRCQYCLFVCLFLYNFASVMMTEQIPRFSSKDLAKKDLQILILNINSISRKWYEDNILDLDDGTLQSIPAPHWLHYELQQFSPAGFGWM